MNIVLSNIADQTSDQSLRNYLEIKFKEFAIDIFQIQKLRSRGCAMLTVLDLTKAQRFVHVYGQPVGTERRNPRTATKQNTLFLTRWIFCRESTDCPDKYLLQTMVREARDRTTKSNIQAVSKSVAPGVNAQRKFVYKSLSCGVWTYHGDNLAFVSQFTDARTGEMMFGKTSIALLTLHNQFGQKSHRVDFPYSTIDSITTGSRNDPVVTLTLAEAPRIYELQDDGLAAAMSALLLRPTRFPPQRPKRIRVTSMGMGHEGLAGSCLVYRITLLENRDIESLKSFLSKNHEIPASIQWATSVVLRYLPFMTEMDRLVTELSGQYKQLDFGIKFQVQRLAQNGYLAPFRVLDLLKPVSNIAARAGTTICVLAIRKLSTQIPFCGPATDARFLRAEHLIESLEANEAACIREEQYRRNLVAKHNHIGLVHRVLVTPAGIYLMGPDPETKNRVLRRYSDRASDSFVRVTFADEDAIPVRYDTFVSNERIYNQRFRHVLDLGFDIAGSNFQFLGFSHSSLREQTCWFMTPFWHEGKLLQPRDAIADLGEFDHIRSPAKCAARIGQSFTDTTKTVQLSRDTQQSTEEVERNGRVFSDGCGTFSLELRDKIWKSYVSPSLKPTLFQIRYRGAKGMISLDTRLKGEVLCIRPSMIKFPSPPTDLEICGEATRPLPLYLNRQLIKILEDLGVDPQAFTELQDEAVERLRCTTRSPINASSFLERNFVGKSTDLPWLIQNLSYIGISFLGDHFLRSAVEMVVLIQLRELKHRARIFIERGVTLFGIMDETNILNEGEIFCCTDKEIITGRVTITRSPALHPGDVQFVNAVNVPPGSPLNALHNCVVFSQRGSRDLPSQLSGGDLDGDIYGIIYDQRLQPKTTVAPADYPRVKPLDIGRPVTERDITDFFVKFMESDQLGRIANLHVQIADQKEDGTQDPDCITLAEMHSTAVDFSKTGIPVNMDLKPKYPGFKPDFMAAGPRVRIEPHSFRFIVEEDPSSLNEEEDDLVRALDPDARQTRFYESEKVLGTLYRAIDEKEFLTNLQKEAQSTTSSKQTVIKQVREFVHSQTQNVFWEHFRQEAHDIKEAYEANLVEIMYSYSPHRHIPLSEQEVFVGAVLGKDGGRQTKRMREMSTNIKERFEADVAFTVDCIIKGSDLDAPHSDEALERSIACLDVGLEEGQTVEKVGKLESFRYVAAAVCLREVEKFQVRYGIPVPLNANWGLDGLGGSAG